MEKAKELPYYEGVKTEEDQGLKYVRIDFKTMFCSAIIYPKNWNGKYTSE